MSWSHRKQKPDKAKGPIVEELVKRGYIVEQDNKVDLLVRHPRWKPNCWRKLELKTPYTKAGNAQKRNDQQDQSVYCLLHYVPYVLTIERALEYLEYDEPL